MLVTEIIEQIKDNRKILSRLLTAIESESPRSEEVLRELYNHCGNAYRIGITGPPGAGKSTITNQITKHFRKEGKKVAIIAVDPTSPFTGGALLGDRVRMSEIGMDEGVFIRSMATRGSLGGLAGKARDLADVFDAAGFDIILFETVGVGQSELDIVEAADTVMVVLVPESGDAIQAMKAGLMEIADFFVLNKSDRPGSEQAVTAIKTILYMRDHDENSWLPDILKTVASENKGITEVIAEIGKHKSYLEQKGKLLNKRSERFRLRIKEIVEEKLIRELWHLYPTEQIGESETGGEGKKVSPYIYAERIIQSYKNKTLQGEGNGQST